MADFYGEAQQLFNYTRSLRRDFHSHPELGFQEVRTAGIIAQELNALGLEVHTGVAVTGVVGLIEGEHPGPTILARFDIDALPIHEANEIAYISQNPGIMHACGHDGHAAIGLTVARLLNSHRDELAGTVKIVFQPAEEGLGGADRMILEGVLEDPSPVLALALHVWNEQPVGWLGITSGPMMAAAEKFRLTLIGKGGHGAIPHLAIDPVLASTQIVSALQSIVSRNVAPLDTAVISVTSIHAGDAFNIIPSEAILEGTIRTFAPLVRERVLERFNQIVKGVAELMECQVQIDLQPLTSAVINDPQIAQQVQEIARRLVPDATMCTDCKTMGSDDMASILQKVPGCYFFVGSADIENELSYPHHHPRFDFDERVLPIASALMAASAVELVKIPAI